MSIVVNLLWIVLIVLGAVALAGPLGYYIAIRYRLSPLVEKLAQTEERLKAAETANSTLRAHFDELRVVEAENAGLRVELEHEKVARAMEEKAHVEVSTWKVRAIEEGATRKTEHQYYQQLMNARVREAASRATLAAEEAFKKRFRIEKEYNEDVDGIVFKKRYLVVNERIHFDERPITPWYSTRRKLETTLDKEELKALVDATTSLGTSFLHAGAEAGSKLLKDIVTKVVAQVSKGDDKKQPNKPPLIINAVTNEIDGDAMIIENESEQPLQIPPGPDDSSSPEASN